MKIQFLGTSGGKPTRERGLSAIAFSLSNEKEWYLFDCGDGTQQQTMKAGLSLSKLSNIFITHLHGDHVFGVFGLLGTRKLDSATKPLSIYGPKGIKRLLDTVIEISGMTLSYDLNIYEFSAYEEFNFKNFTVKILPLEHNIESFAFYIETKPLPPKLDIEKLEKRGVKEGKICAKIKQNRTIEIDGEIVETKEFLLPPKKTEKIIISGDNANPNILEEYLNNLDLLIHETTYNQEVFDSINREIKHTTAKELAITCQKNRVKNLIATHISPRYLNDKNAPFSTTTIDREIKEFFKGDSFLANDFDKFTFDEQNCIKRLSD